MYSQRLLLSRKPRPRKKRSSSQSTDLLPAKEPRAVVAVEDVGTEKVVDVVADEDAVQEDVPAATTTVQMETRVRLTSLTRMLSLP